MNWKRAGDAQEASNLHLRKRNTNKVNCLTCGPKRVSSLGGQRSHARASQRNKSSDFVRDIIKKNKFARACSNPEKRFQRRRQKTKKSQQRSLQRPPSDLQNHHLGSNVPSQSCLQMPEHKNINKNCRWIAFCFS